MKDSFGFVNLPKRVERSNMKKRHHEGFQPGLLSGRMDLTLENMGFLLIDRGTDEDGILKKPGDNKTFLLAADRPVIPGSSLKGVLRSLFEAVTPSCLSMLNEKYETKKEGVLSRPSDYAPLRGNQSFGKCQNMDHLCPACAVFGGMGRRQAWRGRVNIGDARLVEEKPRFQRGRAMPKQLQPRPKQRTQSKQYTDYYPNNTMAGRKFYKRPSGPGKTETPHRYRGERTLLSEPLLSGHHFRFDLHFTNLQPAELGALLRVLLLPDGLVHAIGAAKNHGWGSCRIEAESLLVVDPAARYRGETGQSLLVGEDMERQLSHWMGAATDLFREDAFEQLREMLTPGKRGVS